MTQDEVWLLREKYHGEKTEGFFTDCDRLRAGEPLAYIIGSIPFLGTTIYLDSHPLIPRSETEHWVEQAIQEIKNSKNQKVLDLCAGSGCIGVAVLRNVPNASVDFVEIDGGHHTTIEKNVRENDVKLSRVRIFGGDLFEQITDRYDFILTNPPYIDPEVDKTEESVRAHEPHQALYGGHRGLEIIERIVKESHQFLTEGGTLYMEHEPEQVEDLHKIAENYLYAPITQKDQYGVERLTVFVRKPH